MLHLFYVDFFDNLVVVVHLFLLVLQNILQILHVDLE